MTCIYNWMHLNMWFKVAQPHRWLWILQESRGWDGRYCFSAKLGYLPFTRSSLSVNDFTEHASNHELGAFIDFPCTNHIAGLLKLTSEHNSHLEAAINAWEDENNNVTGQNGAQDIILYWSKPSIMALISWPKKSLKVNFHIWRNLKWGSADVKKMCCAHVHNIS